MKRQVRALIFFLPFVVSMFSGQLISLDYAVNTAAYAKNCENKTRPYLHCNGKCQLMKKIKEQKKKEQENTNNKPKCKTIVLSSKSFFCTLSDLLVNHFAYSYLKNNNSTTDRSRAIFHPPQQIL